MAKQYLVSRVLRFEKRLDPNLWNIGLVQLFKAELHFLLLGFFEVKGVYIKNFYKQSISLLLEVISSVHKGDNSVCTAFNAEVIENFHLV
jgi:hypothetical protein